MKALPFLITGALKLEKNEQRKFCINFGEL